MAGGLARSPAPSCIHIIVTKSTMRCNNCGKSVDMQEIVDCYQEIENQQAFIRCSMVANTIQNIKRAVQNPEKVILFLDIDKTFIFANVFQNTDQKQQYNDIKLCQELYQRINDLSEYYRRLSQIGCQYIDKIEGKILVINFRPGFFEFLAQNYTKLIIVIYTLSKLEYASKVVQILDPRLQLVYRIIARREPGVCIKNVNTVLHNDISLIKQCLIFDDSSVPWAPTDDDEDNTVTFIRSISFYGPQEYVNDQNKELQCGFPLCVAGTGQISPTLFNSKAADPLDSFQNNHVTTHDLFIQDICAFVPQKNYLDKKALENSLNLWNPASKYKGIEQRLFDLLGTNGRILKRFKRPTVQTSTMAAFYDAQHIQLESLGRIVNMLRDIALRKANNQINVKTHIQYTPNPPLIGLRFSIWPAPPSYYVLKTASHQITDAIDFISKEKQDDLEMQETVLFNYTVQLITDLGGGVFAEKNIICEFQIIEWEQLKQQRFKFQNEVLKDIWYGYQNRFQILMQSINAQRIYQANDFVCYVLVFGQTEYENQELQAFIKEVKPQLVNILKTFYVDQIYLYLCGYMFWRQDEFWWMWHFLRCLFEVTG